MFCILLGILSSPFCFSTSHLLHNLNVSPLVLSSLLLFFGNFFFYTLIHHPSEIFIRCNLSSLSRTGMYCNSEGKWSYDRILIFIFYLRNTWSFLINGEHRRACGINSPVKERFRKIRFQHKFYFSIIIQTSRLKWNLKVKSNKIIYRLTLYTSSTDDFRQPDF